MKQLLRFGQSVFTAFALLCLAYFAWQSQDLLSNLLAKTQWHYLAISVLCWILLHIVSVQQIQLQFQCLSLTLSYRQLFYIHVNRLPTRYVPGGIWHSVNKLIDFHDLGIKKTQLGGIFLLENMQSILMSFLIGGSLVFYFRGISDIWGQIAGLVALGSSIGILSVPWLWKYAKLPQLERYRYFKAVLQFPIIWLASSSAFISYLFAFPELIFQSHILEVAGSYIFSWGIGYLAIFAPQGIGVFEVVSGHLLNLSTSLVNAAVVIAGFRVIGLVGDMSLWITIKLVSFRFRKTL